MLSSYRRLILRAMTVAAVLLACAVIHNGQISRERFREILAERARFGPDELNAAAADEIRVKTPPSEDKRQFAVIGIVRVKPLREVTMADFRASLSAKSNRAKLGGGEFGVPPSADDLAGLSLSDDDIEDLKKCVVGNCDIKLPAAAIERLPAQFDWNSPDVSISVTRWYRQMLSDYAADYAIHGDKALMQYDSRKVQVRLADDYRKLLDQSLFVKELAPEFGQYLKDFPRSELSGVENSINWTAFSFGLDPVVNITHSAYYSHSTGAGTLPVAASKQIYGSRYIDSTFAVTLLVPVAGPEGVENYIVFSDLSRSGVLDGPFSGTKHDVVENEAVDKVTDILSGAKYLLETAGPEPTAAAQPDDTRSVMTLRKLGQRWDVRIFLVAVLGVICFLIYRELRSENA